MIIKRLRSIPLQYVWLACLLLVVLVLFAWATSKGPRVRYATFDVATATQHGGQVMELRLNTRVETVNTDQVRIAPDADFTTITRGDSIILTFTQALDTDTEYTITVAGVRREASGRTSTLTHAFRTPQRAYYYLVRQHKAEGSDTDPMDEIRYATLLDSERTIFSAPSIQDYVLVGDWLVILESGSNGSGLTRVDVDSGVVQSMPMPGEGKITKLRGSSDGKSYGYSLSDSSGSTLRFDNNVFVGSVESLEPALPLYGIDSENPLKAMDWLFAPDGTSVIAQGYSTGLELIDTTGVHKPKPLGQYRRIGNFAADGKRLVVYDQLGSLLLDVTTGSTTKIETYKIDSREAFALGVRALPYGDGFAQQLGYQPSSGDYSQYISVNGQSIFSVEQAKTIISDYDVSPSGQYLAVETSPLAGSVFDKFPDNSRPLAVGLSLIDVRSGEVVVVKTGFGVTWAK